MRVWLRRRGVSPQPMQRGSARANLTDQYVLIYHSAMSMTTISDQRRLARAFQALSDETRLQIVELLSTGEHCVCDLQTALGAYQSRLSFHLKRLKDAGLVRDRKDGRWVYYALEDEALEELAAHLQAVRPPADAPSGGRCCS